MSEFCFLMSDVWCHMSDTRCLMSYQKSDVWFETSDVWCHMSNTRCLMSYQTFDISFQTSDHICLTSCLIADIWCVMSDVWCLSSDVRRLTSDDINYVRHQSCDVWCLVRQRTSSEVWNLTSDNKHQTYVIPSVIYLVISVISVPQPRKQISLAI